MAPCYCLLQAFILQLSTFHRPHSSSRSPHSHTMHRAATFPFVFLLLAASPPAATAYAICGGGSFTANGTYEANLRRIAAVLPVETSRSVILYAYRTAGHWPNRVQAKSACFRDRVGASSSSSCAACIAGAFRRAQEACPYRKDFSFFERNCSLHVANSPMFSRNIFSGERKVFIQTLAPWMVLQAIGFGWLLFLLLQEWRDKRRRFEKLNKSPSGHQ